MNEKGIEKAIKVTMDAEKAFEKAKKMCDKKAQKETLAGIGEYLKVVNAYRAALLAAVLALRNQTDACRFDKVDDIEKDSGAWKIFGQFAKKKRLNFAAYEGYNLCKKKQYAKIVQKYGAPTKEGDYNLYKKIKDTVTRKQLTTNVVLYRAFVAKENVPSAMVKAAITNMEVQFKMDLVANLQEFHKCELLQKYVRAKYPVADFKV